MRLLDTIQGSEIIEESDLRVHFLADADIDCDGGSNPFHDPYWQADTTLHYQGKPIDAERVPYMVVPPVVVKRTRGRVLGCQGKATNTLNGRTVMLVVADVGPMRKVGELSPAAAKALGINPHPISGGEERFVILYELWPDKPAVVQGTVYNLQPARH